MSNITARMDRLPITSIHRVAIFALAFAYFFELADLNTFAFAAPGLMKAWHLPVDAVALITSASFGGMFIGAVGGGWLGDNFGRKRGIILCISFYAVFSMLNAVSWDVTSLAVFRFLTGVGLSGMTVIANTYVSEFFPANVRGKYMGRIVTIGLIGIPATAWFARYFVPLYPWGWRLVFVWGGMGLLALFMAVRMKESPRWYLRQNNLAKAEEIVGQLEAAARAEHGPLTEVPSVVRPPVPGTGLRPGSFFALFSVQERQRTLTMLAAWIFQTLGFYGFMSWVPTLLVKHGFSVVHALSYTATIAVCHPLGSLIASDLVERFERRWYITIDGVLIAIFGVAFGMSQAPVFILLFGALVVLCIQGMAVGLYTYTPELFPTEVRSSAMGLAYGVGRLANVIGPFIISAIFMSAGYLTVFVYIGACWLVVSLVIGVFGTNTTGRSLEAVAVEPVLKQR
ncbi:MAG: MFS transporter [Rhodoferax sp.]